MKVYIIVDCNYICYRAQHSMGHLTHNGEATGVVFGFMKTLDVLRKELGSNRFLFCWDTPGRNMRKHVDEAYKANRDKVLSEEELALQQEFRSQVHAIKTDVLPALGYNNNFWARGYEADDLIANITQRIPDGCRGVIVSSDADLYQLLDKDRVVYFRVNKNEIYTEKQFRKDYNLEPLQWADVKAIAGCKSDNVKGVDGVGEKTAAKYLRGELRPQSAASVRITEASDLWTHNLLLVTLPLPGTPKVKITKDDATDAKWDKVCKRYGLVSLSTRKRGRF